MNYLDLEIIKERLPKKGFIKGSWGDYWCLEEHAVIQIKGSSIEDISSYDEVAIEDIINNLYLSLDDFKKLISCKIDKDKYYNTFIKPRLELEI
jgi:hypothetical protein